MEDRNEPSCLQQSRNDKSQATTRTDDISDADGNSGWHHFHPASLLVEFARQIVPTTVFGGLLFSIAHDRLGDHGDAGIRLWVPLAIVALCGLVIFGGPLVKWLTVSYRIGENAVQMRERLFGLKTRTIYYASIHAINATSPVYLRPFGLVNLTISSAGTGEPSITLQAVSASLQLELERRRAQSCATAWQANDLTDAAAAHAETNSAQAMPPADRPTFRASVKDIMLYSITDIRILLALLALPGIVQNLEDILPESMMRAAFRWAHHSLATILVQGVQTIITTIIAVVALLMLISIGMNLVRYYGFELRRRGDDLVVVRGLVTRRTTTMPVSRIQTVVVKQSLLRRLFHLCSVEVGLSATMDDEDDSSETTAGSTILPVVREHDVYRILGAVLPDWRLRSPANGLTFTGRGLMRYYVFAPIMFTVCTAVISVIANTSMVPMRNTLAAWLTHAPNVNASGWAIAVFAAEAILLVLGVLNVWFRAIKCRTEGYLFTDSHGIVFTGATMWTRFTLFTTRARAQSVVRQVPRWRERIGIERITMPLFVQNGFNNLCFTFLRRGDADRLEQWFRKSSA